MTSNLEASTEEVLRLLSIKHNVLVSGPPATGKTELLNLVEEAFENPGGIVYDPNGEAAFPCSEGESGKGIPGRDCKQRKVFRTTFHQGTRYRDFVRGLIPSPGDKGNVQFKVSEGVLYKASEYAKQDGHAALVITDEINRGPAVAVFGDMITAFESDKRLSPAGEKISGKTVTVQIMNDDAELIDYQLPDRLYFLAAMNQADSSVEPLDVAFLRRWAPYQLMPDEKDLRNYFGLEVEAAGILPESPTTSSDVYEAAVQAWKAINNRIMLGRGAEYQIGHGVFMQLEPAELPKDVNGAREYIADCWPVMKSHVDEVFFGDQRALASVYNAGPGKFFDLKEEEFADRTIPILHQNETNSGSIYDALISVSG